MISSTLSYGDLFGERVKRLNSKLLNILTGEFLNAIFVRFWKHLPS